MIDQIFVDLDDVCNRFTMHALQYIGCNVEIDDSDFPAEVGYDITLACNLTHPTKRDWTPSSFWGSLGYGVWHNLPMRPCCHELLDDCAKIVGQKNVFICTKSLPQPYHYSGKMEWIYRHLPGWIHGQIQINGQKETNARPGALLIDDSLGNVKKFMDTRGGQAILVPRPWNPLRGCNARDEVYDRLRYYAMGGRG
jgi:hypothetical protein